MSTPHDLYLRFLVTKGCHDYASAKSVLEELDLRGSSQQSFNKQLDLVERSVPTPIWKQILKQSFEGTFLRWMNVLEIADLWRGEKPFLDTSLKRKLTVIYGLTEDPHLRLALNALLVKGLIEKEIATLLNARFSALLQEEHIKLYRTFFFDPRRMTRKDWKVYLKDCGSKEQHIYFTALSESVDVLKTELEMPAQVVVSEPLQYLLTKAFQKAKQYLELSTKEANQEARAWISQCVHLAEKYEKFKTGDTQDFAKYLQMEFDFVDDEFAIPDQETLNDLMETQKKREDGDAEQ